MNSRPYSGDAMQRFLHHYRSGLPLKDARYRSRLGAGGRARFALLRTVRPLWHPAKRVLEIIKCTSTWGNAVQLATGVSKYRQFMQQISLTFRHGIRPFDYYQFMLYRPELRAIADRFIYHHQMEVALKYLKQFVSDRDLAALKSKVGFYRFCTQRGIRTIPVLAVIHGRDIEWVESTDESNLPESGLFSKPDDMGEGKGIRAWSLVDTGTWSDSHGGLHDAAEIMKSLEKQSLSLGRSILLQPRILNHHRLAAMIGRESLCTARVVTARTMDGNHLVLPALLGIPSGRSETSNFIPGMENLGAPVDPESGRLGPARSKVFSTVMHEQTHHPDTGVRIEGLVLPFWREAAELCIQAHAALDDLPFVGWDVAFTPSGPMIVEGNQGFGAVSPQLAHLRPFGDTPFPELFDLHVRRLSAQKPELQ